MAVNFRRIAKWSSAISVLFFVSFILIWVNVEDSLESVMDPEQQNVARLNPGTNTSIDLIENHVYIALRLEEQNEGADLRLISEDGGEIIGKEPNWMQVDRSVGDLIYSPVRELQPTESGIYSLYNDGDSTLWLVDETASSIEWVSNPSVLGLLTTCCFGVISGFIALIFAILMLGNRSSKDGKQVSGLVIDGKVMTTDELYRAYREQNNDTSGVPEPFVTNPSMKQNIQSDSDESDSQIGEGDSDDDWKGWDEG